MPTEKLTCLPQGQCSLFDFCTQIANLDPTIPLSDQKRRDLTKSFDQVINDPPRAQKILGDQSSPSCVTFHHESRNRIPDPNNALQTYLFWRLLGWAIDNSSQFQTSARGWYTLYTNGSQPKT